MDKIRIVHIIKDDKFYDYIDGFIKSGQYDCIRVLITDKPNYHISWIPNNTDVITLYQKSDIVDFLKRGDYDAIFLQSLTRENQKYIQYVPQDKYVIWWSYGYELYTTPNGMKQLIPVDVYKPLTKKFYDENHGLLFHFKEIVKKNFTKFFYERQRRLILSRIDFFQPVIPLEYEYMLNCRDFHAKEFYQPTSYNREFVVGESRDIEGDIMIGNSCTYTNNHLDIVQYIRDYIPKARNVVIPMSYGDINPQKLIGRMSLNNMNVEYLVDFIPSKEYFARMNKCSYFISGVMRQQSMGNISYCLSRGIKVFLFKDSIVYKYLKKAGFVVYTIEGIDRNSFYTPMTPDEQKMNQKAAENRKRRQDAISEEVIKYMKLYKRDK